MKARFLQNIQVNDTKTDMSMLINEGDILSAKDAGDYYELRRKDGWGTMAPKVCEGIIYEILEDTE